MNIGVSNGINDVETNVEDSEEAIEIRRKNVAAKIKAFEALASDTVTDLSKSTNWWLGQRNNEEFIRDTIFCTSRTESHSTEETKLSNGVIRKPNSISSNGATSAFASILNETLLKNDKTRSVSLETTSSETYQSSMMQNDDMIRRTSGPENEMSAMHKNSLYCDCSFVPTPPSRLSKSSIRAESNIYEEVIYNERRISTTSTMSALIPLPEKDQIKLSHVIQEVISLEGSYIQRLERGIEVYIKQGSNLIDSVFRLKYIHFFSNLQQIYKFHKDQLYRSLVACNEDVFNIANVFHTYITNDSFYPYVLFQVDKVHLEKIILKYRSQFDELGEANGDKLGIRNFLMEPVVRLPRYRLLFAEIIKLLRVNDETVKNFLSVCCMTEKQLRRLVISVDQANCLSDLDSYAEFDWKQQGKFKKMSKLKISDAKNVSSYEGRVYLFENALLCTQVDNTSDDRLNYRAHISLDDIYFIVFLEDDMIKLTLRQNEVCFSGETVEIEEWVTALKSVKDYDEQNDFLVISDNIWDDEQYLKVWRRIETNYTNFLCDQKTAFLTNVPSKLSSFITILDQIIEFHFSTMASMLENRDTTIVSAAQEMINYFQDGKLDPVKEYASLVPDVLELLSKVMVMTPNVNDFIEAPLHHIQNIQTFVDKVIRASVKSMIEHESIRTMANLQKELSNFCKVVSETLIIHREVPKITKCIKDYGIVKYSDLVSSKVGSSRFKIFLMDNGVVAVKFTKNPKNSDEENFHSLKWHLPYPVRWEDTSNTPDQLRLSSTVSKIAKSYKVLFHNQHKKRKFIEQLN